MQKIEWIQNLPPQKTEIYFGLDQLRSVCQKISPTGVIVADQALQMDQVVPFQKALGFDLIQIPNEKTREAKETLENQLFQFGIKRNSLLIAIGGGSLLDLAAFTASTYMRGMPLILIPTTLLAMVDASIGGKTGIDTPYGKNLIGSFYLPKALFIDKEFLKTLPKEEMLNGLSEILKMGLIFNPVIWQKCKEASLDLKTLIQLSIESKLKIVAQDYQETKGIRRILNFGHTVGHAIEICYPCSHGKAVALGCMAESCLSFLLGYLPKKDLDEILGVFQNLGYAFSKVDRDLLFKAMCMDKKSSNQEPSFVLIDQIGKALEFDGNYIKTIPKKTLDQLFEWIEYGSCQSIS